MRTLFVLAFRCVLVAFLLLPLAVRTATANQLTAEEEKVIAEQILQDEEATQVYAGVRYIWLGRYQIEVTLNASAELPQNLFIRLKAGAKNDRRTFLARWQDKQGTVKEQLVEYGGYDGFRFLDLPVPNELSSPVTLRLLGKGSRQGFFSKVAVVAHDAAETANSSSVEMKVSLLLATTQGPVDGRFAEAYPEIARLWQESADTEENVTADGPEQAFRLAARHGRQAHEMFFRCRKYMEGWLAQADPKTGLIPRNLTASRDIWNPEDAAADNYPFLVLAAFVTDRPLFEGRMLEMLRTETRLTSRLSALPDAWSFSKQDFVRSEPSLAALIFGGSEYVKDGLLPLTEYLGPSPWLERLMAIENAIWEHAPISTPFGPIPSDNVEVNGEQLQVLSRIYWLTGEKKYLEWAERLGDYYLLGSHHPTRDFPDLRLRDHGCEIVSGLCELYVAVSFAHAEKADAYRAAIHEMCDRILEVGCDARGMMYNVIHPQPGTHDPGICDTWGYNYNGIYSVYLIDRTSRYREAVRRVLSHLRDDVGDYHWGSADEYADSLEGAINLYNREPIPSAAEWIDRKIRDMWKPQRPDGIIEGWHGDGNVARTALMYAFWKTQGLRVEPWREDIRLGAIFQKGQLYVNLTVDRPWTGRLLFDRPRHKHFFHLPLDYPRINQFPEWFTVDENESLMVENVNHGERHEVAAQKAWSGLELHLPDPGEYRWIVTKHRR
ncbi:hypothetical protein [Thermogutta sp.]|uniref:hypothetical protein n=1 Tax=Thermogutta sp. TaxID=1962930 RepID=UPI003C7C8B6E